jgi:anti-anti-sigma factor
VTHESHGPDGPAGPPYLSITTDHHGQQVVLRLRGELDVSNLDSLRQALDRLLETGPQAVTVNLAKLSFADCGSLSVLVSARKRLAEQGQGLILTDPQPLVRRLLAVTGLDTLFRIDDSGTQETAPR